MITNFIISLVLFIIGYVFVLSRLKLFDVLVNALNIFLFYVTIPLIIFDIIYSEKHLTVFSLAISVSTIHMAVIFAASYWYMKMQRQDDRPRALAFALSLSMSNVAYLAIPLAITVFGDTRYILPYTIAFNIALPVVTFVLSYIGYEGINKSRSIGKAFVRTLPFILAIALALVLRYLELDLGFLAPVFDINTYFTFLSFILIGYEFAKFVRRFNKELLKVSLAALIIKYIVSPIAMVLLVSVAEIDEYLRGLLLQSIMPPAVTNIVLAKMFKLDTEIVSLLIVLLTPISIGLSFLIPLIP